MSEDLKSRLMNSDLPKVIGKYYFEGSELLEDNELKICYDNEEYGYFTIVIYKYSQEEVPVDLDDPVMQEELNNCIAAVFDMEKIGAYHNVQLLAREPYDNDVKEGLFNTAVFNLQKVYEDNSLSETFISFLFLREDKGYYHKIRFDTDSNDAKEVLQEMDNFLNMWIEVIEYAGTKIN
jgi:hypothetical protein